MTFEFSSPEWTADCEAAGQGNVARRGYVGEVPTDRGLVHVPDLEEKAQIWWQPAGNANLIRNLNYLDAQARAASLPSSPRFYHLDKRPVLQVQGNNDAGSRYAIVKAISVPKVDPAWYRGQDVISVPIQYIREGAWRDRAPLAAGDDVGAGSWTVQQHDYSTSQNYVSISASDIVGDAPAPVQVIVASSDGTTYIQDQVMIALRPEPAAGFTGAKLYHLAPTLTAYSKGSVITTPGTYSYAPPGNQIYQYSMNETAGSIVSLQWTITGYTPYQLAGRYLVYALVGNCANTWWSLQFQHGIAGRWSTRIDSETDPYGGAGVQFRPVYVGPITVPAQGNVPGALASGNYFFGMTWTRLIGGSTTLDLAGFFLVPIDGGGQLFTVDDLTAAIGCKANSDLKRAWGVDATLTDMVNPTTTTHGRYIYLVPGQDYRLYVYNHEPVWYCNNDLDVYLGQWPRYWNVR